MLPVILIGATVVGIVALLLGSKSAPKSAGGSVEVPGLRTRVVATGEMPGSFATKWGGSFGKWKELPAVNPGMRIAKWNQWLVPATTLTDAEWVDEDPGRPCSDDNPGPCPIRTIEGLVPWSYGQVVAIPDSWPG